MAAVLPSRLSTQARPSRYGRYATPQINTHFLGTGQVLALCVAMVVLALMLFPKAFIRQQLHAGGAPNAATIAYLELLLRAQPGDQTTRLQLVRERLRAGQLALAERELAPLAQPSGAQGAEIAGLWLSLRRAQFVALSPGSPSRAVDSASYADALGKFSEILTPADQLEETRKATAAGLYVAAAKLAWQVLADPGLSGSAPRTGSTGDDRTRATTAERVDPLPDRATRDVKRGLARMVGLVWSSHAHPLDASNVPPAGDHEALRQQAFQALLESQLAAGHPRDALRAAQAALPSLDPGRTDWAQLIRIAVWAEQPAAGGDFAQHWLASAHDDATRWTAFHALIDSFLAADRPALALAAASNNIDRMPRGPALWRLMTRLAMQAGDANKSAEYARRLVQLEPTDAH